IAALPLKMDAYVQPGQPVATLADFSGWKVETDNLTEIEVPEVTLGQKVSITPDALPELDLPGVVTDISALHAEKRGDVTYTVTVAVEKSDPRLRWGMTMVVTFPPAD
ncbi:MAG: HlyD family efflux transporter periplasmic adaptor subunit, partial [Anaerolineales bacterium]|nr:HlyD family efflux transporter periplasmic adaptor subunit [Anaerolineales bacterium]